MLTGSVKVKVDYDWYLYVHTCISFLYVLLSDFCETCIELQQTSCMKCINHLIYTTNMIYHQHVSIFVFSDGDHGYDNTEPDMHALLLGLGPAFKSGFHGPPMDTIDVYELMCYILSIDPAPNNGTFDHARTLLKDEGGTDNSMITLVTCKSKQFTTLRLSF